MPVEAGRKREEEECGTSEKTSYEWEPSQLEQGKAQWTPPVDLSFLSCGQQEIVKEMSREESGAFATNDGDIGYAKQQKLEIILRDDDPVKKKKNETVSTIGKTEDDRQPIPRIQDILNNLSTHTYLSVLDQGKAYHQGLVTEEHRHLTAFVTP